MKNTGLKMEDSLLTRYVSDEKNDGTYTLNLSNAETLELWDRIDAQTRALRAALDVLETNAEDEGKFWGEGTPYAVEAKEIFEDAHAALACAAPSNDGSEPRRTGRPPSP